MEPDNTVAIVAIAVSGGVALVAAIIAPAAAHFRQKKALTAAADRQAQQLAHDRLLRDLEDARNRFDEVIDRGESALSSVFEARLAYNAKDQQACDDHLWNARNSLGEYGYKERRVRLRIGHDHALISCLATYREAAQSLYAFVHTAVSKHEPITLDAWNVRVAQIDAAQREVIEVGEKALGSRIELHGLAIKHRDCFPQDRESAGNATTR